MESKNGGQASDYFRQTQKRLSKATPEGPGATPKKLSLLGKAGLTEAVTRGMHETCVSLCTTWDF
jgi:hypothetical protein